MCGLLLNTILKTIVEMFRSLLLLLLLLLLLSRCGVGTYL